MQTRKAFSTLTIKLFLIPLCNREILWPGFCLASPLKLSKIWTRGIQQFGGVKSAWLSGSRLDTCHLEMWGVVDLWWTNQEWRRWTTQSKTSLARLLRTAIPQFSKYMFQTTHAQHIRGKWSMRKLVNHMHRQWTSHTWALKASQTFKYILKSLLSHLERLFETLACRVSRLCYMH